jgi:hypothetical protein
MQGEYLFIFLLAFFLFCYFYPSVSIDLLLFHYWGASIYFISQAKAVRSPPLKQVRNPGLRLFHTQSGRKAETSRPLRSEVE